MFILPIFFAAVCAIVVIAAVRRAACNSRRPFRTFTRAGECGHADCRHLNRPAARFCARCGRPMTSA